MKSITFCCLILILQCKQSFTQITANLNQAKQAFDLQDYYNASIIYEDLFNLDTTNISNAFMAAEAFRLDRNYKKAKKYYSIVCNNDKDLIFPLSYFWLGIININNKGYSESIKNLSTFLTNYKNDDYYQHKALKSIESNKFVIKFLLGDSNCIDTKTIRIDRLPKRINTPHSEFAPLFFQKKYLLFSSNKPFVDEESPNQLFKAPIYARIYESKFDKDTWQKAVALPNNINEYGKHVANASFSKSTKKLYFSKCEIDKTGNTICYICSATYKSNQWENIEVLSSAINKPGYSSTQPCIVSLNKKEEILYFSSNMPGGLGNYDIWYAVIKNGKVFEPSNLGSIINTEGNEITPFYYLPKNELYFSSDWHSGLGGYDIFKSKGGLNNWQSPHNLKSPFNTSADDYYFVINSEDTNGYFSSNRIGSNSLSSETCCNDIYSYEWIPDKSNYTPPPDTLFVKYYDTPDEITKIINNLLPIALYFDNDQPNPAFNSITTNESYQTLYKKYVSRISKYKTEYSKDLTKQDKKQAEQEIEQFFKEYVLEGLTRLDSATRLLVEDLKFGSKITLSIKGFCSPLSTNEYNINLAKRRISSLINYFKEYNKGELIPYMNNNSNEIGKLIIKELPIGETEASIDVSDNPNDIKNSIYSKKAALERKIEISVFESVRPNNSQIASVNFKTTLINFGTISNKKKVSSSILFENTGNLDVYIEKIETNTPSLEIECAKNQIKKGNSGQINVTFNPELKKDKNDDTIRIYFKGFERPIVVKVQSLNK